MKLSREEIDTIPNKITAGRLALAPAMAWLAYKHPKLWWIPATVAATDRVDGFLAGLGDDNERLRDMGFRRSQLGKKLDPTTDIVYTSLIIGAGLANRVIPKRLGAGLLIQKLLLSAQNANYERRGIDLKVTNLGRYTEAATNLGIATIFAGENFTNPETREKVRAVGSAVAWAGLAVKFYVGYQFRQQANEITDGLSPLLLDLRDNNPEAFARIMDAQRRAPEQSV